MDGAGIAAKAAYGYAKSAQKAGLPHQLYRPIAPITPPPLDPACLLRTVQFISSASPIANAFSKPSGYGKPIRYALLDSRAPVGSPAGAAMQAGDYISGTTGTFFIASLTPDEDPMVVECNDTVAAVRPAGNAAAGKQPYGGRRSSTDVPLFTNWPASVIRAGRTIAGHADLPGDVPDGGFELLMPVVAGVVLRTSDRVADGQGRSFVVSAAEYSELGVRAVLVLSVA